MLLLLGNSSTFRTRDDATKPKATSTAMLSMQTRRNGQISQLPGLYPGPQWPHPVITSYPIPLEYTFMGLLYCCTPLWMMSLAMYRSVYYLP
jgi:hypothetical protein